MRQYIKDVTVANIEIIRYNKQNTLALLWVFPVTGIIWKEDHYNDHIIRRRFCETESDFGCSG